jgi:hypothetical protein
VDTAICAKPLGRWMYGDWEDSFIVLADKIDGMLQERAPKITLRFVTRTTEDFEALREGHVHLDIGEMKTKVRRSRCRDFFGVFQ